MSSVSGTPAVKAAVSTPATPPPRPIPPGVRVYLLAFNVLSCLSWLYVWLLIVHHLLRAPHPLSTLHSVVRVPLQLTQSLATLEILHSLLGLTRSSPFTTALQVSSRLFIVWCILYPFPPPPSQLGFLLASLSWATVEVPRYLYYAWSLASPSTLPYALTWLRYSLFLVLYPSGITGELLCIAHALPYLAAHPSLLSLSMPNKLNFAFSFHYAVLLVLALYVPGSPLMISTMWAQRKKVLGTAAPAPGAGKKEL